MYSFAEYLEEAAALKSVSVKDADKHVVDLLNQHFGHLLKKRWTIGKFKTYTVQKTKLKIYFC